MALNEKYRRVGTKFRIDPENLIAGPDPELSITQISLATNQGPLLRGTLLGVDNTYENAKPIGTSFNATTGGVQSVFVLAKDYETDDQDEVNAAVYRRGFFQKPGLIFADEYELTRADIELLRHFDIYVTDAIDMTKVEDED